jgi:hypothetical protein
MPYAANILAKLSEKALRMPSVEPRRATCFHRCAVRGEVAKLCLGFALEWRKVISLTILTPC